MTLHSRWLLLAILLSVEVVFGGNTTCISSNNVTWWNGPNGESPCRTFERLMQVCNENFAMWDTLYPPGYNVCYNNTCCCNTIAYALQSACWSCQWGTQYPASNPEKYMTFLGEGLAVGGAICVSESPPGVLPPAYLAALQPNPPPPWTFIPVQPNDVWDSSYAELNATFELVISSAKVSSMSTRASPSTTSPSASFPAVAQKKVNVAVIAGSVVGGIMGLAAIAAAAIGIFFWARRPKKVKKDRKSVIDIAISDIPPPSPTLVKKAGSMAGSIAGTLSTRVMSPVSPPRGAVITPFQFPDDTKSERLEAEEAARARIAYWATSAAERSSWAHGGWSGNPASTSGPHSRRSSTLSAWS